MYRFRDFFKSVVGGLVPYYPVLRDKGFARRIMSKVVLQDTGNDQMDIDNLRDQVERLAEAETYLRQDEAKSYIVLYNCETGQVVAYVEPQDYEGIDETFRDELDLGLPLEIQDVDLGPGEEFPSIFEIWEQDGETVIPQELLYAWEYVDCGTMQKLYSEAVEFSKGSPLADYLVVEYAEGTEDFDGNSYEKMRWVVENTISTLEAYLDSLDRLERLDEEKKTFDTEG